MRKHQLSRWAVAVTMAILALATIYPLLFVTNVSTKTSHEYVLDQFGLADQLTPVNFVDAWTSSDLGRYIVNSVTVTVGSVVLLLLLGSIAGFAVSHFRFL